MALTLYKKMCWLQLAMKVGKNERVNYTSMHASHLEKQTDLYTESRNYLTIYIPYIYCIPDFQLGGYTYTYTYTVFTIYIQ